MLRRVKIKFSIWTDKLVTNDVILDDDIIWYQNFSVTNAALMRGFCNYWTVINEKDYIQLKELNPDIHFRANKLVDKYVVCMDNVEPFDIKTTDDKNYLLNQLDLKNTIIMCFDEHYNILSISKIRTFDHPFYTFFNSIRFYRYNNEDLASIIQNNDPLTTEKNYVGRERYVVMKDNMKIWDAALNYMISKVDENVEYVYHYKWRHNIIPPKISMYQNIHDKREKDVKEFKVPTEYLLWMEESNKLLDQFNLTSKDLK